MSDQFVEFSGERVVSVFRAESPLSIVAWYRRARMGDETARARTKRAREDAEDASGGEFT